MSEPLKIDHDELFADWVHLHPEWDVRVIETVDIDVPKRDVMRTFEQLGDLLRFASDDFVFTPDERAELYRQQRFWWIERSPSNRPTITSARSSWNSTLNAPHTLLVDTMSLDIEVTDLNAILAGEIEDVSDDRVTFMPSAQGDRARAAELRSLLWVDGNRKLSDSQTIATLYSAMRNQSVDFYANANHPFVVHAQTAIAQRRRTQLAARQSSDSPMTPAELFGYVIQQSARGQWFGQPCGHDDLFGSAASIDSLCVVIPMHRDDIVEEVANLARHGEVVRSITGHVIPADWHFAANVQQQVGAVNLLALIKPESRSTFLNHNPDVSAQLSTPDQADQLIASWFNSGGTTGTPDLDLS